MSKTAKDIESRRVRNRSVPPPPPFDPSTLPDNALLTAKELAGWLRLSLATLEDWRLRHPHRGPPTVSVAGLPRYRIADVRNWLLGKGQGSVPSAYTSSGLALFESKAMNQ
jgi:hypothetical protein